jgi:hypothetical protein
VRDCAVSQRRLDLAAERLKVDQRRLKSAIRRNARLKFLVTDWGVRVEVLRAAVTFARFRGPRGGIMVLGMEVLSDSAALESAAL